MLRIAPEWRWNRDSNVSDKKVVDGRDICAKTRFAL
jgi:hypothetical protein